MLQLGVAFALTIALAGCGEDVGAGAGATETDQDPSQGSGANAGEDDAGSQLGENGGDQVRRSPVLPVPTGPCPSFSTGTLAFSAQGIAHTARVWIDTDAAAAKDGPLVLYWHATGSVPTEAVYGLSQAGVDTLLALGGIVVAPEYAGKVQFPWILDADDYYALTDEIVACAAQEVGIDARRIHSAGMSAGGLFTTKLSFARSGLLASVLLYSGGGVSTFADPSNKFAAMVFHGGSSDAVYNYQFAPASVQYANTLRAAGHLALLCDHGSGHNIPAAGPIAAVPFFLAHPFGATSPYEAGFPASVPDYCAK